MMGPFLDPIKALIQCCDGEIVDTVIVDGEVLVQGGQVLRWNEEEPLTGVRRSCRKAWDHFSEYWPDNESIDQVFPSAFKEWDTGN